jgi:hypothetical protein
MLQTMLRVLQSFSLQTVDAACTSVKTSCQATAATSAATAPVARHNIQRQMQATAAASQHKHTNCASSSCSKCAAAADCVSQYLSSWTFCGTSAITDLQLLQHQLQQTSSYMHMS